MNDLRSLEGIGQLLSQKFNQNSKHKLKSRHIRRNSDSLISSSTPTASNNTTTPICEYFPAEIASLLSANIQMGYYSNIASQAPVLLKSHSDFVREDILNLNDLDDLNDLSDSEIKTNNNDQECIILNLPVIGTNHNNDNNNNNTDRDFSFSLTIPPSLAPLVLEDDYSHNELFQSMNDNNTADAADALAMDIIASYDDEDDSDDDVELFDFRNDYMQYQNKNTNKTAFNNIGNGASGIVKKAFHYKSGKMVAIKQCRSKQKHEICAAIKEAKLYGEFSENKHIIDMFEYGKDMDDGDICVALEYMDLGSIDTLNIHEIITQKRKELIVRYIIYSVLLGINELHNNLYVHNDIKMANILSNKYGDIKVSDFGTVLRLDDKHSYLSINNGTQIYQSPEKLTSNVCKYNTKTDIWSIGITAYELLFGERSGDNQLSYITNTPLLTPKKCNLSADCCDFVNKCLIHDDKQRPSAQQLLAHKWFNNKPERNIWPWLVNVDVDGNAKKHKKRSSFGMNNIREHEYYNEDLLFMISALIINYSTQSVTFEYDSYDLYRRISHVGLDKDRKVYSDCERIQNMAHYALCSAQMVIRRIRVTVAYIKSQLNKADVSRIDS